LTNDLDFDLLSCENYLVLRVDTTLSGTRWLHLQVKIFLQNASVYMTAPCHRREDHVLNTYHQENLQTSHPASRAQRYDISVIRHLLLYMFGSVVGAERCGDIKIKVLGIFGKVKGK